MDLALLLNQVFQNPSKVGYLVNSPIPIPILTIGITPPYCRVLLNTMEYRLRSSVQCQTSAALALHCTSYSTPYSRDDLAKNSDSSVRGRPQPSSRLDLSCSKGFCCTYSKYPKALMYVCCSYNSLLDPKASK